MSGPGVRLRSVGFSTLLLWEAGKYHPANPKSLHSALPCRCVPPILSDDVHVCAAYLCKSRALVWWASRFERTILWPARPEYRLTTAPGLGRNRDIAARQRVRLFACGRHVQPHYTYVTRELPVVCWLNYIASLGDMTFLGSMSYSKSTRGDSLKKAWRKLHFAEWRPCLWSRWSSTAATSQPRCSHAFHVFIMWASVRFRSGRAQDDTTRIPLRRGI